MYVKRSSTLIFGRNNDSIIKYHSGYIEKGQLVMWEFGFFKKEKLLLSIITNQEWFSLLF